MHVHALLPKKRKRKKRPCNTRRNRTKSSNSQIRFKDIKTHSFDGTISGQKESCTNYNNIPTTLPSMSPRGQHPNDASIRTHARTHPHVYPYTHSRIRKSEARTISIREIRSEKKKEEEKKRKERNRCLTHTMTARIQRGPGDACACTSSPRFHPRARSRFARGAWKPRWR